MQTLAVIFNPNAGRSRSAREGQFHQLETMIRPQGRVYRTGSLHSLRAALEEILRQGTRYLVCDGGDGTLNCVLNLALECVGGDENALPVLVPTRSGTIDFVAQKDNIFGGTPHVVRTVARDSELPIAALDTLSVRMQAAVGAPAQTRVGFALAAGGIGQNFFEKYYDEPVRGRRAIAKIVGTAISGHLGERTGLKMSSRLITFAHDLFQPTRARVTIDGKELAMTEHVALNAGSIDVSFRGLMRLFPEAKRRGVLHFHAGELDEDEILPALSSLIRGAPIIGRRLVDTRGRAMHISSLEPDGLLPILDGERLPASATLEVRRGPSIRVPLLNGGLRRRAAAHLGQKAAAWRHESTL
jgi:diacylglycerol kinase family enzyme